MIVKICGGTTVGQTAREDFCPLRGTVDGQVGELPPDGRRRTRPVRAAFVGLGLFFAAAFGWGHAARAGTLVAWGKNDSGQATVPSDLGDVTAAAGGVFHSLALRANGTVVAWGRNLEGQTNVPAGLQGVRAVAAGSFFSMALKSNGTVVAWGSGNVGQTNIPPGLSDVASIAAGSEHGVAARSNGTVVAWGRNIEGQADVPQGLNNVTAVAAGIAHTVALRSDGTVVAWGPSFFGEATVPPGLNQVKAISAGYYHTVAVRSNGTVVIWGRSEEAQAAPGEVNNVASVATGALHSLALRTDGTVVSWGENGEGQLNAPTGLAGATAIAAGGFHSLAVISAVRPTLTVSSDAGILTLRWPATATAYRVESTPSLSPPRVWTTENHPQVSNGGFISMAIPMGDPERYFRLVTP